MTIAEARRAGHCEDCHHPHPHKPVPAKVPALGGPPNVFHDTQRCHFCQRFHQLGQFNANTIEVIRHMNWIENERRWDESAQVLPT